MIPEQKSISTLLQNGDLLLVQDGNHGGDHPTIDDYVMEGGIPLITGANINNGLIDYENSKKISFKKASELKKGIAKTGDILLTHKGTMGKTAMVSKVDFPFIVINPQITIYRVNPSGSLDSRFLKYYFDSPEFQEYFIRISSTSTISTLSLNNQKNLKIPLPHRNIQFCISEFLQKLDEKIEHNKKTNETLEDIAKAIFKSWFIDFDPVRAKSEGRSTGLPNEISDLFPDSFEDSELGAKPQGWQIITLSELINLRGGLSYRSDLIGSGDPIVNMGCVSTHQRFKHDGLKFYNGECKKHHLLSSGDIVIATRQQSENLPILGYPAYIPDNLGRAILATNMYKVEFLDKHFNSDYIYQILTTQRYKQNILESKKGSTVSMITKDSITDFRIPIPPSGLVNYISEFLSMINSRINVIYRQQDTLSELRDNLLPKLISGELRISDAEKMIDEVAI